MHARMEGFAKQDLSILISVKAVQAQADKKKEKTQGTLYFFNSLNPLWKKSFETWLCSIFFFILVWVCDPIQRQIQFIVVHILGGKEVPRKTNKCSHKTSIESVRESFCDYFV